MTTGPRVSIVVPAYCSQETAEACLFALRRQSFRDFETIVVDSSPDERTAEVVRKFSEVDLIRPGRRMLPHEARNTGARAAQGEILVFTDPDCVARQDWLARIVRMHDEGWKAAGGAVVPDRGWWNLAVHWVRYGWWVTGGRETIRDELASANSSFSREVWEKLGGYNAEHWAGDSEICWRLRAMGEEIRFDPDAVVAHYHPMPPVRLILDRYARGRDYGRCRVRACGWGRGRAVAQISAVLLAPVVMTLRAARYAAEAGRLGEWALFSPIQWAAHSAWCAGEARSFAEAGWGR